ncbi:hypothetical protein BRCON_1836 [Candidatus Sumerlaea chitinivorans]|uniref:Uncharacterized protein n=1 Tax=Sumerlaea chitinivorans TaxID=2250252 RepID=A0A2Z4Y847_SUMC1|nr:hypothetical protein BRCON_1836 [Candidatus Sumerlaea chitinivorans]
MREVESRLLEQEEIVAVAPYSTFKSPVEVREIKTVGA